MDRRKISILLTVSLILSGMTGLRASYASERLDIISETYETVSVEDDGSQREGVVSETFKTTPASDEDEDAGSGSEVVRMLLQTTPVDENGNPAEGTETMEISGESSMPDMSEMGIYAKDVVNMVLPVIPEKTYDFVMDPHDLLSRYSIYKENYEKASIYFTNSTGEKTHTCISDVAMAKNKSSVPVLLYVTLQVENEYGWPVNYTDMDAVEEDNQSNISFALIPVSANEADGEPVLLEEGQISVDETGKAEMVLYLPGTPDNFDVVEDKYMAREDAVWSSLGFAVKGKCNPNADWSVVDERSGAGEKLKIHISYRMDILSDEQKQMLEDGSVPEPVMGVVDFNADNDGDDREDAADNDTQTEDVEKENGNEEVSGQDTPKDKGDELKDETDDSETPAAEDGLLEEQGADELIE